MVSNVTYRKSSFLIPLGYHHDIEPIIRGELKQTTRSIDSDFIIGDVIMFHTWEGVPYDSPWKDRSPHYMVTDVAEVRFSEYGLILTDPRSGLPLEEDEARPWSELDQYAADEGLVDKTGEGLKKLLFSKFRAKMSEPPFFAKRLLLRKIDEDYTWKGKLSKK